MTINHCWSTEAEVAFLQGLGTFNPKRHYGPQTRKEWLTAYALAMPLRADWGSLDLGRIKAALVYFKKEAKIAKKPGGRNDSP